MKFIGIDRIKGSVYFTTLGESSNTYIERVYRDSESILKDVLSFPAEGKPKKAILLNALEGDVFFIPLNPIALSSLRSGSSSIVYVKILQNGKVIGTFKAGSESEPILIKLQDRGTVNALHKYGS